MDAPGFNPTLHPRDLVGRWARVASGDQAAKKLAKATTPRGADGKELKSDYNFTGSKETQYHHRSMTPGQMDRSRDLSDHQDELYELMRGGLTFEQAKQRVLMGPVKVNASESAPKKKLPKGYSITEHPSTTSGHKNYVAHDDEGNLAGFINVSPNKAGGEYVSGLMVYPEHQRKGLATVLWEHAGRPPHDPEEQSSAGAAWAKSVGGEDRKVVHPTKPLALPTMPVDAVPLRRRADVKAVIKEIEATGRTDDNSRVRRVLNSARNIGDTLFAARNVNGDIVAAALVDITGGKRSRQYSMHALFKDADAPPKSGTLLMVEVAKAAKAENAELHVAGAVATARTFYEEMGGDFRGTNQPSGVFTSQSTHATWSTEARDALADGRPIPAQHYLIEGPMVKTNDERQWTNSWVEPPRRGRKR